MSTEADAIRGDDDPWELLTIQTHALEAEEDKNTELMAENQRLREALLALERSSTARMLSATSAESARTNALLLEAIEYAREALAGDTE